MTKCILAIVAFDTSSYNQRVVRRRQSGKNTTPRIPLMIDRPSMTVTGRPMIRSIPATRLPPKTASPLL